LKDFNRDLHLYLFFTQNELDTIFSRAAYAQNKYIIDYVELNPIKVSAQSRTVSPVNFDFLLYTNTETTAKKPDYDPINNGHHLCYIGFLQYVYLVSLEIVKRLRPYYLLEVPAAMFQAENEEEEEEEENEDENVRKNFI
jgi:hypothetical protein